jgi:glycosyltransferase involved in cell wall biosynthesis
MGIDIDELQLYPLQTKTEAVSGFGINLEGKKVLLTVGRLIRRKGHAWFVRSVLKKLPHHYVYLMAGSGPEAAAISKLVGALGLTDRAYLLGSVSDQVRNCLYQIADLLIMPNVHVKNDEEGFGMVALEAGRYGLPVIAANIEGIRDAVIDGETGRLINEQDDEGFLDAILTTHIERTTLMRIAAARFGWTSIVQRYYAEFEEMRQGKS